VIRVNEIVCASTHFVYARSRLPKLNGELAQARRCIHKMGACRPHPFPLFNASGTVLPASESHKAGPNVPVPSMGREYPPPMVMTRGTPRRRCSDCTPCGCAAEPVPA